jgi:hypothetical protein
VLERGARSSAADTLGVQIHYRHFERNQEKEVQVDSFGLL